jgi:membrane fusion protein, copper/silver efflux system
MKHSQVILWVAGIVALVILVVGAYFLVSGPGSEGPTAVAESDMPRYRAGGLEIGVKTDPSTPRVGDNRLIVDLREPSGNPVSVAIDAYAEMPAMGAMQAMRAPADLKETAPATPGRTQGSLADSMGGKQFIYRLWPPAVCGKIRARPK